MEIIAPNTVAFTKPVIKSSILKNLAVYLVYILKLWLNSKTAVIYPPNNPMRSAHIINIGNTIIDAKILGAIKYLNGLTFKVVRASICSVMRIVPISAAIDDPTFPIIIKLIKTGPNSLIMVIVTILGIICSWLINVPLRVLCKTITAPIKMPANPTIGREKKPISIICLAMLLR